MTLVFSGYLWALGAFVSWQSSKKRESDSVHTHLPTSPCSQATEWEMDECPSGRHHQTRKQPVCYSK